MTFAQVRNCLTTHFSERIPVVKRRISLLCIIWGNVRPLNLPRVLGSVLNWTHCTCWPHEGILFPDLGIRWRWVVNITLRPLYLQGENPDAERTQMPNESARCTFSLRLDGMRILPLVRLYAPRMELSCSLIWIVALPDRQYLRQFLK